MEQDSNLNDEMGLRDHSKNGKCLKSQMRKICVIFVLMFMGSQIYGQNGQ